MCSDPQDWCWCGCKILEQDRHCDVHIQQELYTDFFTHITGDTVPIPFHKFSENLQSTHVHTRLSMVSQADKASYFSLTFIGIEHG